MGTRIVKLPDVGEGVAEAEIVEWHVAVGQSVLEDQVLADRVADLDVPGDDLGLGDAFADVGQLEFVASHQSAMTFSSAFFMRFGPGK